MTTWSEHIKSFVANAALTNKPTNTPFWNEHIKSFTANDTLAGKSASASFNSRLWFMCDYCDYYHLISDFYDYDYDYDYDPYYFIDKRCNTTRHNNKKFWYRHNNITGADIIYRYYKYDPKQAYVHVQDAYLRHIISFDPRLTDRNVKYYFGRKDFDDIPGRNSIDVNIHRHKSIKRRAGNGLKLALWDGITPSPSSKIKQAYYKRDTKKMLRTYDY